MDKFWLNIFQWWFPLEAFFDVLEKSFAIIPLPNRIYHHIMISNLTEYYNKDSKSEKNKLKTKNKIATLLYYIEYWDVNAKIDTDVFEKERLFLWNKWDFIAEDIVIRSIDSQKAGIIEIIESDDISNVLKIIKRKDDDFIEKVLKGEDSLEDNNLRSINLEALSNAFEAKKRIDSILD